MPIEIAIAGISIPFVPARDGYANIVDSAKIQNWNGVMDNLKSGFLGIDNNNNFDLAGLINPFDFNNGRYMKMLVAAGLVSKVRKRLVKVPFDKIPFIGRYIS